MDSGRAAIAAPSTARPAANARFLQRACACGGKKAGECEACRKKRVQRKAEAYNKELIPELRDKLLPLPEEGRLNLLGVDGPRRSDPAQRAQTLTEIQEFIDGKDADGKVLGQRARWEKVFPHLRRVEVLLERELKMGKEPVEASNKPTGCDDADKAFIDSELGPIPVGKRLPQEEC